MGQAVGSPDHAAAQTIGAAHGNGAYHVADLLLHLEGHHGAVFGNYLDGIVVRAAGLGGTQSPPRVRSHSGLYLSLVQSRWTSSEYLEISLNLFSFQSGGAADDIHQLTGNARLAGLVVGEGQVVDQLFGGIGRAAHGHHPRRVLAGQ